MRTIIHVLTSELFWLGFAGWFLQALLKSKAIQDDARRNNIKYKFTEYFTHDWLSHLITFTCLFIAVWKTDEIHHLAPVIEGFVGLFFVAIGASGGMIISYLVQFVVSKLSFVPNTFSVATRVNEAIKFKTNLLDESNGTAGTPTPK